MEPFNNVNAVYKRVTTTVISSMCTLSFKHDRSESTWCIVRSMIACVASVSSRVRRESWDESKKKGMTGEGEGNEGTLLPL